jgi:hypothetical protein
VAQSFRVGDAIRQVPGSLPQASESSFWNVAHDPPLSIKAGNVRKNSNAGKKKFKFVSADVGRSGRIERDRVASLTDEVPDELFAAH